MTTRGEVAIWEAKETRRWGPILIFLESGGRFSETERAQVLSMAINLGAATPPEVASRHRERDLQIIRTFDQKQATNKNRPRSLWRPRDAIIDEVASDVGVTAALARRKIANRGDILKADSRKR